MNRNANSTYYRTYRGFTIIEVMIVLGIAGLILTIVLLAVPALERSKTNDQRKSDAAFILSARANFDVEQANYVPPSPISTNCGDDNGAFGDLCSYIQDSMSYYTAADITIINNGYSDPGTPPTVTTNTIVSESYLTCDPATNQATVTGASWSTEAVVFAVETSGGGQQEQCLDGTIQLVN